MFSTTTSYDAEFPNCPSDTVSRLLFAPNNNSLLMASSWNKTVCIWECRPQNQIMPRTSVNSTEPVLTCDWSTDGAIGFFGGCDNKITMWNIATNQTQQIGVHDKPVNFVGVIGSKGLVCSTAWDNSLKFWDTRQPTPAHTVSYKDKLCVASIGANTLCIAAIGAPATTTIFSNSSNPVPKVILWDLANLREQSQSATKLNHQITSIKAFNDGTGYIIASIEGRCSVVSLKMNDEGNNFTFRCHRKDELVNGRSTTALYPVNDIGFTNIGSFSTVGSDGNVFFWDRLYRSKLKSFDRTLNLPVTCGQFNNDGTFFAYAAGYDWFKGKENASSYPGSKMYLHYVNPTEITPKPKK